MYLAEAPSREVLEEYYTIYSTDVKTRFSSLLAGNHLEVVRYGITYHCKITTDAVRNFFIKYSQDDNLRKLLTGDLDDIRAIIQEIMAIDPHFMSQITKAKHNIKQKGKGPFDVEDLNAMFHKMFVEEFYEKTDIFNKNQLVEWKSFQICPYCGARTIITYDGTGNHTIKAVIDHYLPKSKFPYFAISFQNLFPVCTECNDIHNKSENNPLTSDFSKERLMHPYSFDSSALSFVASYKREGDMNLSNFDLTVCYSEPRYREGYNDVVAIENYYKTQKSAIKNIYTRIFNLVDKYKTHMSSLHVKDYVLSLPDYFFSTPLLLGIEDTQEEARQTEKHKFQIDVCNNFIKRYIKH